MPHTPIMQTGAQIGMDVPATAEALLDYQRQDFACIKARFEAAGLTFTDPKNLLK
jgi:hypothetical protein